MNSQYELSNSTLILIIVIVPPSGVSRSTATNPRQRSNLLESAGGRPGGGCRPGRARDWCSTVCVTQAALVCRGRGCRCRPGVTSVSGFATTKQNSNQASAKTCGKSASTAKVVRYLRCLIVVRLETVMNYFIPSWVSLFLSSQTIVRLVVTDNSDASTLPSDELFLELSGTVGDNIKGSFTFFAFIF